jgi:hypothetical protein
MRYLGYVLYAVVCLSLAGAGGFIVGAWSFRHIDAGGARIPESVSARILQLAHFPSMVNTARKTLFANPNEPANELIIPESVWNDGSRQHQFPGPYDQGYLLLSGVDPKTKLSNIRLIRISNEEEIARWDPDWGEIHDRTIDHRFAPKGSARALRAMHPLLLDDGSVIFNTHSVLVRIPRCERNPAWILNGVFHHSNEIAADGTIWTPSVNTKGIQDYDHPLLKTEMRDDSLANITTDGILIKNLSFASILKENGLAHLLLGFSGARFPSDPVHINQISPAMTDGTAWKTGDLLISSRHLSTVFLYRPSTNRIIWHKTGPWLNQHSTLFVDRETISIFDNNVFSGPAAIQPFTGNQETNRLFVVNIESGKIQQPFAEVMKSSRLRTITEGRAQLIKPNQLFVEETNYARHLVLSQSRMEWSRLNRVSDVNNLGAVGWSRYLTIDDIPSIVFEACN